LCANIIRIFRPFYAPPPFSLSFVLLTQKFFSMYEKRREEGRGKRKREWGEGKESGREMDGIRDRKREGGKET
jgi:hypothetical protein